MKIQEIDKKAWTKRAHEFVCRVWLEDSELGLVIVGEIEGALALVAFWDGERGDEVGIQAVVEQYYPGVAVEFGALKLGKPTLEKLRQLQGCDLFWVGTAFQRSVWRELLKVKKGQRISYSDIAQAVGRGSAVRAVGSAVGSNPLSIVVPCHRVLPKAGGLGGYAWGLERKKYLLS